jgi:hypothetical protein
VIYSLRERLLGRKVGLSRVGVRSEKAGDVGEGGELEAGEATDSCGVILSAATNVDEATAVL